MRYTVDEQFGMMIKANVAAGLLTGQLQMQLLSVWNSGNENDMLNVLISLGYGDCEIAGLDSQNKLIVFKKA